MATQTLLPHSIVTWASLALPLARVLVYVFLELDGGRAAGPDRVALITRKGCRLESLGLIRAN